MRYHQLEPMLQIILKYHHLKFIYKLNFLKPFNAFIQG